MRTLRAIADAKALDCWNDIDLVAVAPDLSETPLPDAHLTELIARGWLATVDLPDGKGGEDFHLNLTTDGVYWLERWTRDRKKRKAVRA